MNDNTNHQAKIGGVAAQPTQSNASKPQALIGSKIRIKGELYGEEDILIQGQVEGTIEVKDNNLTVGSEGRVHANSEATQITVEGEVRGDLTGQEKVIIRATSNVEGNIQAPRVSLEEGAKFKGMIDMEPVATRKPIDNISKVDLSAKASDNKPNQEKKRA